MTREVEIFSGYDSRFFGVPRILPDGSVYTPQPSGRIERASSPSGESAYESGSNSSTQLESVGPEEIHRRAMEEETEATFRCQERLLRSGYLESLPYSHK